MRIAFPFASKIIAAGLCSVTFFASSIYAKQEAPAIHTIDDAPLFIGRPESASKNVLNCYEAKRLVGQFLTNHYLFKTFNDELSKRTFKSLLTTFDSGKYYFTQADVKGFAAFEDKIDDNIQKTDCRFLVEVRKVYLERFAKRHVDILKTLDKPFKFDVDEEITIDRHKVAWAKDVNELDERWRKKLKFQVLNLKDPDGEPKARERLKKRYEQAWKSLEEDVQADQIYSMFLNAFASALDPHSAYMLPEVQEDFAIRLSTQLEGIGTTLTEDNGYVTIISVIPGGPAGRDGRLRVGDKIIAVDPGDGTGVTDLIDLELSKAVRLIRGKKGTEVKLTILRKSEKGDSERIAINLIRDEVKVQSAEAKSEVMEVNGKKIGVLRLPTFYTDFVCRTKVNAECRGAAFDVLRELKKLQAKKIDGIVFDLRSNGGGDLGESLRIAGLFIPDGPLLQTVDKKRQVRVIPDPIPNVAYSGPLVILINKQSASASEIISGAIQDYARGFILGDTHTYGKGTVQGVIDIPGADNKKSNGAIKVTQSKFYRASGESNQERGIESDIVIPDLMDVADISEKRNEHVLPWDSIKPAPLFKPLQDLSALIPKLKAKSEARVSKSKEFADLKTKMEKFKSEKDKMTASLKDDKKLQAERIQEKSKRDKEREEALSDEQAVIKKDDLQLNEAANILSDAIELTKDKTSWVTSTKLKPL